MLSVRYKAFIYINYLKVLPAALFFVAILIHEFLGWVSLENIITTFVFINLFSILIGMPVLKELECVKRRINWVRMQKLLKREKGFPVMVAPSELMNRLTYYFPILIIEKFFGVTSAGQYSLTLRVCFSPISLITSAVGQVFQADIAQANRDRKRQQGLLTGTFVFKLIFVALAITSIFYFIVPLLVKYIFGPEWNEAIDYIKALSPLFGLMSVITPLTTAFHVYRKNMELLVQQSIFLIISLFSFGLAWYVNNLLLGVVVFSILSAIRYLYILYMLRKVL